MNAQLLKVLLAGEYICPIAHDTEYGLLADLKEQDEVNSWLGHLNMRLARVGDEGAFFMAPAYIGAKELTQARNELLAFRDTYGRVVLLLDFIRQAKGGNATMSPGEYVQLYELESAVAHSSTRDTQLKTLVNIVPHASVRNTNHENLRKALEHLTRDGYLVLADKETGTFRVTGKVEQLYAVLQFLDEHKVIPDAEVDDRSDDDETEKDLVDQARGQANGDQGSDD